MKKELKVWLDFAKENYEDAQIEDFPGGWLPELKEMSRHYFRVRYPDLSRKFYAKRENIAKIVEATKEIYQWLIKRLEK